MPPTTSRPKPNPQIGHLAAQHRMIGNLYPTPADRRQLELSPQQIRAYHDIGFIGPVRILDDTHVQTIRDTLERILEPAYPHAAALHGLPAPTALHDRKGVIHFQGPWTVEESIHDLVFAPRLTIPLCQLLGTDSVRFFHDQIFYKPARHGGVVAWHQDYSYWTRTQPIGHITAFIALDDSTLENGCLHLVPRSHRWNLLPKVQLTGDTSEDMESIKSVMTPQQLAEFKPVPMQLKAGEVSFHHCLTLHGSYANQSPRPRRSLVLNYMRPNTLSASNEPLMPGAQIIPPGQIVEDPLFPIAGGRD